MTQVTVYRRIAAILAGAIIVTQAWADVTYNGVALSLLTSYGRNALDVSFDGLLVARLVVFLSGASLCYFLWASAYWKDTLPKAQYFMPGSAIYLASLIIALLGTGIPFRDIVTQLSFVEGNDWQKLILVPLFAAITEEVIFRGALLAMLLKFTKSPHLANLLQAIVFAVTHDISSPYALLHLLLLGIVTGLTYQLTKTLWTPIGIHFANNIFADVIEGRSFGFIPITGKDDDGYFIAPLIVEAVWILAIGLAIRFNEKARHRFPTPYRRTSDDELAQGIEVND